MKALSVLLIVCLLLAILPVQPAMAQVAVGEIVFVSEREGVDAGGIYVMYANGSNVRKLTEGGNSPAWSPDGSRIAFGRWGELWGDIWVMFANGSGETNIISYEGDEYGLTNPSWSPDGRKIVYEDYFWSSLFIETPYGWAYPGGGHDPDWSPDGTHIVYFTDGDIYVMNIDGSNNVNLTNDPANDRQPVWSPDGTQIAFVSDRGGNDDIYIMNADGSGLKRLMDNSADDQDPTWSPDGTHLAFTQIMPNGKGDIFVMNANGGNQTNITNHSEDDSSPDWKPANQMNVHPVLLVSSSTGGQVGGIRFKDEDILAYDLTTHTWQMYFDGSDVGLGANDVNALGIAWNGDPLLSFNTPQSIRGLGMVDDSDIISFIPATFGQTTTGAFDIYFTGSDYGLTSEGEDVDAIGFDVGNTLVLSTLGDFRIGELGKDKDLLGLHPWYDWLDIYLVGADYGLTRPSEDISDVWFDNADLYLSTIGAFAVPGVEGDGADIFIMGSDTFRPFWDGSAHGFGGEVIDAFDIIYATELPVTAANVDEVETEELDDTVGDDVEEETSEESPSYQNFLPLITQ